MRDWAEGDEARNYRIARATGLKSLREAVGVVLLLAVIAGLLFSYIWIRGQISAVAHQDQQIRSEMDALVRTRGRLISEEQALKSPERIDAIARAELGMIPLQVDQILPAPATAIRAGQQEVALATVPSTSLPK